MVSHIGPTTSHLQTGIGVTDVVVSRDALNGCFTRLNGSDRAEWIVCFESDTDDRRAQS